MHYRAAFAMAVSVLFLMTGFGCSTSGGSSGGWVVVDQPEHSPPQRQTPPPRHENNQRGQEVAARNHIRSAYRFLEKGKPDHALRELEKARAKMGRSYWFNYYMGGAYYLKGVYNLADNSWKAAFEYTSDNSLRSRVRTCQSFAINYIEGDSSSGNFLKMAIEMDGENRHARLFLQDLLGPGAAVSGSGSDSNVGFKGKRKGKGTGGKGKKKSAKGKLIRDMGQFREYFLVEMP